MATSSVGPRPPKNEPPTGWAALLAILACWGITLRLVLLICLPIVAVVAIVAIVAVVAIYLGPVGVGALLTVGGGGGYGIKRFIARRRRRRAK
jgi:hypothetical protein